MSYRLTMRMTGGGGDLGVLDLLGLDDLGEVIAGMTGLSPIEFELVYETVTLREVRDIARVLSTLHLPTMAALRTELRTTGTLVAGPLTLAKQQLTWGSSEPLALDEVESVELFDNSPIELRVTKRGKVWPYGKAETSEIPNLIEVMELARELGYRVRGIELLAALRSAVS